jgi:Tfp pilus assembly protein PilO
MDLNRLALDPLWRRLKPSLPPMLLGCVAVLGGGIALPLPWTVREQRQRLEQFEMLLDARPKAVATRMALAEQVDDLQEAADQIAQRIPPEDPAVRFLAELRQLAAQHEVQTAELQALPITQLRGCRCREVQLQATGQYAGIARLLREVENREYLVEITRIRLAAAQEQAPYTVEARFAVYFDPQFNDRRKGRSEP